MTRDAKELEPVEWLGTRYEIILSKEASGGAMSIVRSEAPPDSGPPLHVHHDADETFVMLSGEADPAQIAGLLLGLRARGETLDELVGFTKVMREYAVPVDAGDLNPIDLCGTGGDHAGTFNISTAAN